MFRWVENRLNLRKDKRSTIYRCKPLERACHYDLYSGYYGSGPDPMVYDVIYIELAPFWLSYRTRTYFVTIMLRAAHQQDGPPLQQLMQSWYCCETSRATAVFLDGCTHADVKRHNGWVVRFGRGNFWTRPKSKRITLKRPATRSQRRFFEDNDAKSRLTDYERSRLAAWIRRHEKEQGFSARKMPPAFQGY